MVNSVFKLATIASLVILVGCGDTSEDTTNKRVVGVVDETNLNDIMLTVADPNDAVNYFRDSMAKDPSRIDFHRGLAVSLTRAKRTQEAVIVYAKLVETESVTDDDHVNYAGALIRVNEWDKAAEQLNMVPPTVETLERYRYEALIADSQQKWDKSDSFYETAAGLATQPSGVLNNWGFSKLNRGAPKEAEKLFLEAITYDPKSFTAKNNLVLARSQRGEFSLPIIPMTETERAQLLYTAALSAVKQGKTDTGRGLLEEAIDLHPRHFPEAVNSLRALNNNVVR